MLQRASLSTKLIRTGAILLMVGLTSIGLTLWVTWQLEGGAAAVNEAGRMRMQTWRLSSAVLAKAPRNEINDLVGHLNESLSLLRAGDPVRPLFVPWNPAIKKQFEQVTSLWQQQRDRWAEDTPPQSQETLSEAGNLVRAIDLLVLEIEQQLSRYTAILNLFQFLMMALAIGAAVVMLYTGYLYVILPLDHLRQGLRMVEAGQFSTRIDVATRDEFGQVAASFNRMAATLQSLYGGLEAKVLEKTRHIEAQRSRLEALYGVSAFLADAHSIDALCKGFSEQVRKVMKADAVAVRWSDEANQRYLMLASDGLPADLVESERSLIAGSCSCGNLASETRTRVIPIVCEDKGPQPNCARIGYQSVINVPLRLQQRPIGEINLFYSSQASLKAEEHELLDALASHLANAIEGLRAEALEREAAVGNERALLARELHDSIAQSLAFLKIQVQLLRSAVAKKHEGKVDQILNELDTGLRESIGDVRELLVHFRTRTNTEDIEHALQETLQKFQHQTGLQAHLQIHGDGLPLPPDVQVQVLHVIQEALSNVRKHAGAGEVTLEVSKGASWHFTVRDNGRGFDSEARIDESHVGLRIMRERAQRIGATVALVSEPGQGTVVTLILPPNPVSDPTLRPDHIDLSPLTETHAAEH